MPTHAPQQLDGPGLAHALFHEAADALFLVDPDTESLVDVNAVALRLSGFDRAKLLGMPASYLLRSQAQAEYAHENYGHFGLNLDRYAHFTSPIRRYADLIVHRALVAALDLGKDGLTDGEIARLPTIAQHISQTERRAMLAERETSDRLLAQFLATKIGAEFMGRVSGATRSGRSCTPPTRSARSWSSIRRTA